MTTLADINQTLVDQGEKQERTVEAIESLVGRIADLVNFGGKGPDDQLDKLEDRREKAAEERRNRMAGMGKVVSVVKENSGLLAKLLGGGALLGLLYFSSQEFRNDINAIFARAGKIIVDTIKNSLPSLPNIFDPDNPDNGIDPALLGPAAVAVPTVLAGSKFMGAAAERQALQGRINRAVARSAELDQERFNQRDQTSKRAASQKAAANSAQQRFSTQQKLSAIKPQATLGQRIKNLAAGAGKALLNPRNLIRGGIVTEGAFQVLRPTETTDNTIVGGAQQVLESPELYSRGVIEEAVAIMQMQNARYERGQKGFEGTVKSELYKPGALQGVENFLQTQRDKPIGFEGAAPIPFLGRFFGQNNVESVPGSSGMNIMQATENLGGAPGGGATVIQQDNSTNTYIQGGGGSGGTSGGVVPLPSDINVQRLDILGNFGTGRLM